MKIFNVYAIIKGEKQFYSMTTSGIYAEELASEIYEKYGWLDKNIATEIEVIEK